MFNLSKLMLSVAILTAVVIASDSINVRLMVRYDYKVAGTQFTVACDGLPDKTISLESSSGAFDSPVLDTSSLRLPKGYLGNMSFKFKGYYKPVTTTISFNSILSDTFISIKAFIWRYTIKGVTVSNIGLPLDSVYVSVPFRYSACFSVGGVYSVTNVNLFGSDHGIDATFANSMRLFKQAFMGDTLQIDQGFGINPFSKHDSLIIGNHNLWKGDTTLVFDFIGIPKVISGNTMSESGNPMENVIVSLTSTNGIIIDTTNPFGEFSISLTTEAVGKILFVKEGYSFFPNNFITNHTTMQLSIKGISNLDKPKFVSPESVTIMNKTTIGYTYDMYVFNPLSSKDSISFIKKPNWLEFDSVKTRGSYKLRAVENADSVCNTIIAVLTVGGTTYDTLNLSITIPFLVTAITNPLQLKSKHTGNSISVYDLKGRLIFKGLKADFYKLRNISSSVTINKFSNSIVKQVTK